MDKTDATPPTATSMAHCSFCGASLQDRARWTRGPDVVICDQCVAVAAVETRLEAVNPLCVWGYEHLADVLVRAFTQAAHGKGKERHANDKPFDQQPMQTIADTLNSPVGIIQQVHKKSAEALALPHDRAVAELLGAIVYAAGAVVWLERHHNG
jgi:hypothetical protein